MILGLFLIFLNEFQIIVPKMKHVQQRVVSELEGDHLKKMIGGAHFHKMGSYPQLLY